MKSLQVSAFSAIAALFTSFFGTITSAQVVSLPSPAIASPIPSNLIILAKQPTFVDADVEPEVGVIQQIRQGDTMCYITYRDEFGKTRTVGALFKFCENPRQYLNRRMRLVYGVRSVNDCQSEEPCGKTRRTHVVIRMDTVDRADRNLSTDSVVLRNQDWAITVGNRNSWSGVNGTGNLTYRGCDSRQQCLNLTGGIIVCRSGFCSTSWRNGEYTYNLLSPITTGERTSTSTLVIRRNNTVIQEIKGLK